MNEAQLTQFAIPTESKTAATSFLRANLNVAREFANTFGVTDTDDDRVALRAAQMAAVAIFEEVDDVAATIGPKIEQYRTYIKNTIPASVAPVTVTTVEVSPVEAEPEAVVETVEVAAEPEVVEIVEVSEPEAQVEVAAEVSAEPEPEATVEPEVAAEPIVLKAKGKGRGKVAYALTGKVTAYQKCVNWLSDNGITTTDDRSALALKLTEGTGVPVGSCLVYISTAFKAGLLTK
jgi:hypothetical protein